MSSFLSVAKVVWDVVRCLLECGYTGVVSIYLFIRYCYGISKGITKQLLKRFGRLLGHSLSDIDGC